MDDLPKFMKPFVLDRDSNLFLDFKLIWFSVIIKLEWIAKTYI